VLNRDGFEVLSTSVGGHFARYAAGWMGQQRLRLAAILDGPTKIAAGGHVGWAHKDCGWRPCWMGPQRLRLAAMLDGPTKIAAGGHFGWTQAVSYAF